MVDTPAAPENPAAQPQAPSPQLDALQQYRIEQIESGLEKLQERQDKIHNDTINQQTGFYKDHLNTLSLWGKIISTGFVLVGILANTFIYFNVTDYLEKTVEREIKVKTAQFDKKLAEIYKELETVKENARKATLSYEEEESERELKALMGVRQREKIGRTFYKKGIENFKHKNFNDAIKNFTEAISYGGVYGPEIYDYRGNAYQAVGRDDEAIKDYDKAIEYGMVGSPQFNKACIYSTRKESDKAFEALRQVIHIAEFREKVKTEPCLSFIRNDPRFKQLVGLE